MNDKEKKDNTNDTNEDANDKNEEKVEEKEESKDEEKEEKSEEPKKEEKEKKDDEDKKEEDKKEDDEEEDKEEEEEIEVPDEYKDIVEKIEKMTVMELNALVKFLEKKFGVSAQAVAAPGAGGGDGGGEEEKDEFTVELKSAGDSKIGVIKAVKASLGLGLKEAKDLVEGAPAVLKEGVKKEDAEEMKNAIEEAGGEVELN